MRCDLMMGWATADAVAAHVAQLKRHDEQQAAKKADRIRYSLAPTAGRVPSRCALYTSVSQPAHRIELVHPRIVHQAVPTVSFSRTRPPIRVPIIRRAEQC